VTHFEIAIELSISAFCWTRRPAKDAGAVPPARAMTMMKIGRSHSE